MAPRAHPPIASKRKALKSQVIQQIEMFDQLTDPLLQITGRKGRIKWANRAANQLLGDELIHRRVTEVFKSKALKGAIQGLKASENGLSELILGAKNFPGLEFRVRLVHLEKKTPYGARILLAMSDVTQVLRLQTQRQDFVANASHELKTPVAALSGFIETLEQDPGALSAFLPLMSREASRMRDLIHDLLNLTRTEMETHQPPSETLALQPLIDQAVAGIAESLTQRQQNLTLTPLPQACYIRADSTALITVFSNLLSNASKYAPHGSLIRLEVSIAGTTVRVAVINAGAGIAPHHIARLTERFYRADQGRARAEGGTGLGLAIVKHALIRHKGELLIASSPGEGARFTVVLPCETTEP